jgi:hypothetical protein
MKLNSGNDQKERRMKYSINVIKSVWRRLPKPSRVTLNAVGSRNSQKKPLTQTLDSAVRQHIAWLEADRLNLLTMAKTVVRLRDMNVIPGSEIINVCATQSREWKAKSLSGNHGVRT